MITILDTQVKTSTRWSCCFGGKRRGVSEKRNHVFGKQRAMQCMLQCVAVCCRMLQCAAACWGVSRCVAVCFDIILWSVWQVSTSFFCARSVCCGALQTVADCCRLLQTAADCCGVSNYCARHSSMREACVAHCCNALQCAGCSVLQCAGCSVLQCVAVCCSVLQCAAMSCSVLQCVVV